MRSLDGAAVSLRPSPDRWTIREVIGHLIDSASNNHQRFVRACLADPRQGPLAFPGYEQREWVRAQAYDAADWQGLVELWARYNRHLAHVIRHAPPSRLGVRVSVGGGEPVTLGYLIEDYLAHLRHHLGHVARRVGAEAGGTQGGAR